MPKNDENSKEIIKLTINGINLPKIAKKPIYPLVCLQLPTAVLLIGVILILIKVVQILETARMANFCN